jgi:hypothetical protein
MKNTNLRFPTIKFSIIIIVVVYLLIPEPAVCLDRYPADLNLSTVQTACDEVTAAGGGNIYLPSGTSPWWTSNLKLVGGCNLIGAGSGSVMTTRDPTTGKWGPTPTTIIRSAVSGMEGIVFINSPWYTKPPRFTGFRMSNIRFLGTNGSTGVANIIVIREGTPNFRIDHCEIDSGSYQVMIGSNRSGASPVSVGVIDHCNVMNSPGYGLYIGERPVVDNKPLGTSDAVYIEDNFFTNCLGHQISGFCGAHWVARYNVFYDTPGFGGGGAGLDVHGPGWCNAPDPPYPQRGGGPWEIYNNDFAGDPARATVGWAPIAMRSLHGVVHSNTFRNCSYASYYYNDGPNCSPNCPSDGIECGLDSAGRSGSYTPGVYIWNNAYINVVPGDGPYKHYIQPDACTTLYVRYGIEVFGYNDGNGSDHGVPKPGYTPYTYPHPLVSGAPSGLQNPPLKPPKNLRTINP